MGKTIAWFKLPGPFGFPRYGWIAGIGAMLVAGYIFYHNRKQNAQTPTVNPVDALAGGNMMPTTYPYPTDPTGSGFPSPPPIPPTWHPGDPVIGGNYGDPHGLANIYPSNSRQVPTPISGNGERGWMQSGSLIVTPTQNQTGQRPTVLSNSAIMPIQQAQAQGVAARAPIGGPNISRRGAAPLRPYNTSTPPGAVGNIPPRTISPASAGRAGNVYQ